jgi:hypothetical protein
MSDTNSPKQTLQHLPKNGRDQKMIRQVVLELHAIGVVH